jgi:hypothetical protein
MVVSHRRVRKLQASIYQSSLSLRAVSAFGRFRQLMESKAMAGMCRFPPLTIYLSVSPLEKTDAQIQFLSGGYVPTTDPHSLRVSGDLRHIADGFCCSQLGIF